jgi:two-component system response regulator HydG
LLERELFGYEGGTHPGTPHGKPGLLATAGEGTVFFDDIEALSQELQSKLLRALQDKAIRALGGGDPRPLRARILASSSRDLAKQVELGRFRKDLFYRLNVVNIRVPALRERKEDIPLLATQLLERMRRERGVPYAFSEDTLRLMLEYDWPGNIREMELVVERACALSSGPVLHLADMPTQLQNFERDGHEHDADEQIPVSEQAFRPAALLTLQELERQAIVNALRQLKGDKIRAARMLGIGKTTLYRKLKEYGITDELE